MEIINKVAIIAGGTSGFSFTIAQFLLRSKIRYVAIFDLVKPGSVTIVKALKKLDDEFSEERFGYYECDVTNIEEFTENYDKIMKLKNDVDILINNQGIINDNDIDLTTEFNFKAHVKSTLIAIERMRKRNNNGIIVNIASFLGLINTPLAPVYNATRHAVVSFVRSMTNHNKTLGVRIVCICPGMTKMEMIDRESMRKNMFDFVDESELDNCLSLHLQEPENVASAVIEIIKNGCDGDVWVTKDDEPPFAVGEETNIENMRIPF